MSQTLLGLYDGYMPRHFDTLTSETKIGGRPTYFPPLSAEQRARIREWTTCGVCGHSMYLLLQAYSPLPSASREAAHHRMLYVFACNSSSCARQPSNSWTSFSLQVNRDDDDDADYSDEDEEKEDLTQDGARPLPASALPPNCFPPCHVYIEAEPAKAPFVPTALEKELIAKAEQRLGAGASEDDEMTDRDIKELEETVDLKDKRSDYLYEKFRARVARAPTQVLRYHQRAPATAAVPASTTPTTTTASAPSETPTGALTEGQATKPVPVVTSAHPQRPIFMNPDKVKRFVRIPSCAACGAGLVHELQVMPTSLYYLRVSEYVSVRQSDSKHARLETATKPSSTPDGTDHASTKTRSTTTVSAEEGLDFATATVYVCSRDCAVHARTSSSATLIHTVASEQEDGEGSQNEKAAMVVVLRREFVCVESPPTVEEEKLEKKMEDRARAGGVVRKDFREMLEAVESEEDEEEAQEKDDGEGQDKSEVS